MSKLVYSEITRRRRLIGLFIVVALATVVSAGYWLTAIGGWLAMPATLQLHPVDAIIVHGGNPTRTDYGITLYHHGLAPELWHTSYADRQALTTLVVVTQGGVPSQSFHYLATTSTWTDGTEIAATIRARKLHSVIIVTDWWHSRRALCSTEQQLQGYDVAISFEPSPSPAGPLNWWKNAELRGDVGSELVKLMFYMLRYGMRPWGC